MEIILAGTHTCHHLPIVKDELRKQGVPFEVRYFEENPDMAEELGYKESPLIIVEGEVRFRGMPAISELRRFFEELKDGKDAGEQV